MLCTLGFPSSCKCLKAAFCDSAFAHFLHVLQVFHANNQRYRECHLLATLPLRFVQFGDRRAYYAIKNMREKPKLQKLQAELNEYFKDDEVAQMIVQDSMDACEWMALRGLTAMQLAAWAMNISEAEVPKLQQVQWNYSAEEHDMWLSEVWKPSTHIHLCMLSHGNRHTILQYFTASIQ